MYRVLSRPSHSGQGQMRDMSQMSQMSQDLNSG